MNRRHKKKQQTDYLALIQTKWSAIDWQDYLNKAKSSWGHLPRFHQRALMVLVPIVFIITVIPFPNMAESGSSEPANKRVELDINTRGLSEQRETTDSSTNLNAWREYTVQKGDTLSQVFRVNNLPMADLNALVKIEGSDKPLSHIQQGQLIRFKMAEQGRLDILQLEKNGQSVMFFRLSEGGFGRSK
ncbi:lysine transporter LysM [Vibrio diazotrophicus]|jgi:cell envelope opacity-associated protein A|uniref:LysM-like peptidoglycan-binding domain-containing protein n=1 Tax=Vibrio diazotrophicus TaxID=685 RepID=UPI0022B00021|nr:LysM-like peptidoglycan-binding domain-containing protein [Vibrio diazotrophicus]MCZ4372243.1 lysine transporter LysM [Vibrio diazotrophicus]